MVYEITKLWLYPFCRLFTGKIDGKANIQKNKNFIVVANHRRLIDPILIAYIIRMSIFLFQKKPALGAGFSFLAL